MSESNSVLRHARYVVAENPVTGFAFAMFLLIAFATLFGPYIVPHDPLASDTAATLQPPSIKHWFGTDQLGRDIFSRVVVATNSTSRSQYRPSSSFSRWAASPKSRPDFLVDGLIESSVAYPIR